MRGNSGTGAAMARVAVAVAFAVTAASCKSGSGKNGASAAGTSTGATVQAAKAPPNCSANGIHDGSEIAASLPQQFGAPDSGTVHGVGLILYPVQNVSGVSKTCFPGGNGYVVAKIRYANDGKTNTIWNHFSRSDDSAYLYVAAAAKGEATAHVQQPDLFRYEIRKLTNGGHASQKVWTGHAFFFSDASMPDKDQAHWGSPHAGNATWQRDYGEVSALPHPGLLPAAKSAVKRAMMRTDGDTDSHKLLVDDGAWFSCDQGCCNVTGLY